MLTVALTGGLASGKSTVGRVFASLGCCLIEADAIGHAVLAPDGEAYPSVVAEFGPGILTTDGSIDRRALAAIVFADPARLAVLNSLVHPHVRARVRHLLDDFKAQSPQGIAIVEAAIHIETGGYRDYDRVVLAYCRPEQQVERAMARDRMTREEALARLARQMPLADKQKFAHYVIDTSGTKEATAHQTQSVYHQLRSIEE
jgi:dephospho-CoA kinase